jgi:DNA polymerase-3 subunit epsilon
MEFFAVDVETANSDMASICQIGIAHFVDSTFADGWKSLIDPEDEFDVLNICIHGIDETMVKGAPKFPEIKSDIQKYLYNHVSVCHTHFDRVSLEQVCRKYSMAPVTTSLLDSAMVTRRTWEQFAFKGYGLQSVCNYLGYQYKCHDALEDAKAAGYVLISAVNKTGLDIDAWIHRVKQPIDILHSSIGSYIQREGNPEGPLYGEVIVFTGALSIHRNEAADLAAKIGCKVEDGVNKQTTLLVVGDQDIRKLAGHEKSNKHQKAEKLILQGQSIRILRETDFLELIKSK